MRRPSPKPSTLNPQPSRFLRLRLARLLRKVGAKAMPFWALRPGPQAPALVARSALKMPGKIPACRKRMAL